MIKFDKDGWIIKQVIKLKVNHEDDHDRLYDGKKPEDKVYITEKWLKMLLEKRVSKTEMYFIISLENKFKIKRIQASSILKVLMDEKIKELNRFVKRKQSYSLNIYNSSYIIFTPHLYFEVDSKKEYILNFMKQQLIEV